MKLKSNAIIVILLTLATAWMNGQNPAGVKIISAAEVIETIIKNTGVATIPNTVDVFKDGNPETAVKGIITCMFATMEVLKEAVDKNCNLIIAHEPLYYNHLDDTRQFLNDPVFIEKRKFITEHNLVIWRFHDYIHRMKPDGIESGMADKLGWKQYAVNGQTNQFILPETTLSGLLEYLKQKFPENSFNVVGKPEMKLSGVRLSAGAPGSGNHIRALEDKNTDVVIAGESPQWETYEYMRDAVAQGRKKAIVFIGHIASEEAGMDYCSSWLKTFIRDLPVYFVKSGPSYWSY
jgi:putative NIF3 family GTP cyclohydrolase 1 type 2